VEESRLVVVPNGVPIIRGDATAVRKEFDIRDDECVLLAVGNLETHKGHVVLLEALARIADRGASPRWKLIIAGGRGGDQHGPLLDFVRRAGLGDTVKIVLNRDDIPDLLALANVFVMPSLWEGLPMAMLEAMLARKAIVASATAGIPEAIVDGREGILVPPGDVGALSTALDSILGSVALRTKLGTAAGLRAEREFTVEVMADRYERLYRGQSPALIGQEIAA
jgi:glycosyltransferase involved in cell wall biosynthesis